MARAQAPPYGIYTYLGIKKRMLGAVMCPPLGGRSRLAAELKDVAAVQAPRHTAQVAAMWGGRSHSHAVVPNELVVSGELL